MIWRFFKGILIVFGFLFALGLVLNTIDWSPSDGNSQAVHTVRTPPPLKPIQLVYLKDYSWSLDGFGTVAVGNFTVQNGNEFAIKDIAIRCEFSGKSGTVVSRADTTIYDTVAGRKNRTFRKVNMGFVNSQSASATCRVVAVN